MPGVYVQSLQPSKKKKILQVEHMMSLYIIRLSELELQVLSTITSIIKSNYKNILVFNLPKNNIFRSKKKNGNKTNSVSTGDIALSLDLQQR